MTIIHTSDWHLGHTLYGHDRSEEMQTMLDRMVALVSQRRPDALVISGDVYHTAQPAAAVQRMFAEAMVAMRQASPDTVIVVTAGNHDSGSRHEIFSTPWQALGIHAVGQIHRDEPWRHIIEAGGRGYIVAVPYCHSRNLPEGFYGMLLDEVASRNTAGLPVVLMAHTTVAGADFAGHDNAGEYTAGGVDAVDVSDFGEGYDYLALGHIHRGQFIHTGRHNVRYSGTPLAVSFDETGSHTVSVVTLGKHGDKPAVETVDIDNPRPLLTLPATGAATWAEVKAMLSEFPAYRPAYLRLSVDTEGSLPTGAFAEATALVGEKEAKLCCIVCRRRTTSSVARQALSVSEFREMSPADIAARYAEDTGEEFDDEMKAMFHEALSLTAEDLRNED